MDNRRLDKPISRTALRRKLGKEFYILKRRKKWMDRSTNWCNPQQRSQPFDYLVKQHQSLILRPLKDVDMVLQHNKRTNLEIAIRHLNGTVIAPNETFSFWKQVGRPTAQKGYLEGLVLHQGKVTTGTGGGLCQLGNLLLWIFAHSPIDITERLRHSFDVFPDVNRKVPFGAGATLSYNYIDFQVYNPTTNTFQLSLWLDDTQLHGSLTSLEKLTQTFRIEERDHRMDQQIWGGYTRHNAIVQISEAPTGQQSEKLLVQNNAIMMYSPFLEQ